MVGKVVQVLLYVRGGEVASIADALVRKPTQFHDFFRQIRSEDETGTVIIKLYGVCVCVKTIEIPRHSPQALVHAGVDGQTVLVPVDVVRVHPRASDAGRLFERYALEGRVFGREMFQRRQSGRPAANDPHGHRPAPSDAQRHG